MPLESIFDVCSYSITSIKHLYIGARQLDGSTINYPIDYNTITGTTDSIIQIDEWNDVANYALMGGQYIEWVEVPNLNDNITFNEEYVENKQGKTYVKDINFQLPNVNFTTNANLKEFLFTADGEFAISNAIAFIIDNNNQNWIVGYDLGLILNDGMEISVANENFYSLSFRSISYSRVRNFQIIENL